MRTFAEFVKEVCDEFPQFAEEVKIKALNFTQKSHAGHANTLYQVEFDWYVIQYTLNKKWVYHFNGYVGEGISLNEASNDHSEKYSLYFNQ